MRLKAVNEVGGRQQHAAALETKTGRESSFEVSVNNEWRSATHSLFLESTCSVPPKATKKASDRQTRHVVQEASHLITSASFSSSFKARNRIDRVTDGVQFPNELNECWKTNHSHTKLRCSTPKSGKEPPCLSPLLQAPKKCPPDHK